MRVASYHIQVGQSTDQETVGHPDILGVAQVNHGESSTSYHLLHEWYSEFSPLQIHPQYFPDTDLTVPTRSSSLIEYQWQSSLSRAFVLTQGILNRAMTSLMRVKDWIRGERWWCSSSSQ